MSEWWTYRLSDFLLFSPRTYHRLFELYNTDLWPMHLAALAWGAAVLVLALQGRARAAWAMLAACWLWVAWAFLLARYATINWAAPWFAAAFAIQGIVLLLASVFAASQEPVRVARPWARVLGIAVLLFALAVLPGLGVLQGRPWTQAEVFGMAPDPTAIGTLGALLLAPRSPWRWLLWPIPVLWCLVAAATAWTMQVGTSGLG